MSQYSVNNLRVAYNDVLNSCCMNHDGAVRLDFLLNKLCAWRHNMPLSSHLFVRWRWCSGITISLYLFARWHLFRHVGYLRHQQQVDLWPFDLESEVVSESRVMWDYLCANFSLPRPLYSRVRPDVRDRQTDRRETSDRRHTKTSLNGSAVWGWSHNDVLSFAAFDV